MEGAAACCDQIHSNKENIPPLFSAIANTTNPFPQTGSSSSSSSGSWKRKCKKLRSRRKPLADITNHYLWQYRLNTISLPPNPRVVTAPPSSVSNPRKRKAIQETHIQVTCSSKSKSLRMGFR